MKIALALTLGAGLLAGCGSSKPHGVAGFAADVRSIQGFQTETDAQLSSLGEAACQALSSNDYGQLVQATTEKGFSTKQAEKIVQSAVHNLCPQYDNMLP